MLIGDRLIGRDRELSQLDLAIGPGDDGLRLAMLRGPSGLGKTTLTGFTISRARERGFCVRLANGRAGSLSTPFASWLEALPELKELLGDSGDTHTQRDMEQIGVSLINLLQDLAQEQPLLLVFDDAQALDESSIALLPYAAGVSERANITLMFVEQSDAVDVSSSYRSFVDSLLARRIVQHLHLGPMSDEAISELVREVLGDDHAAAPTEVVLRAQGNPWFAKELAESYRLGEADVPVSIAAAATSRLHRLEETSRDLVYAVALCPEGAHIGWLESIAEEKPRVFVRTMDAIKLSGIVREDGEFISIAHPLMRQALLEELSAAMRRALHLELADVISATPVSEIVASRAQGYHLSQAGKADEAVSHYLNAAEANEIVGQLHEAFADYVRALDAEPRIEHRVELLKLCALRAVQLSSERAAGFWSELARIAATKNDNDMYAYALFQQYWTSYDGTAMDRLERAASLGPDEYGWSARAAANLNIQNADYKAAITHDLRALELSRQTGDGMLETLSLEKLGLAYLYTDELPKAVEALSQAVSKATTQRLHNWAISAWGTLTEALTDNLETERSLHECEAALKYTEDLGLERYRALAQSLLARRLLRVGRLEDARRNADQALEVESRFPPDRYSAYIALNRAEVAVEAGDVAAATDAVNLAIEYAQAHGYQSWIFDAHVEKVKLLTRTGKLHEALELAGSLEIDEPSTMAGLALWFARTSVQNGGNTEALELAGRISAGIEGGPCIQLMLREVQATRMSDTPAKIEELCAVADAWQAAARPLDALQALTTMGTAQLAQGDVKGAIETFTNARQGFAKCGASNDADYVAGQLRALGTRSRARSRTTNVGNLTKRELEIARLVATGLRNAEVASQLFLAEKTVAAHLSNIYGKLEVRSRVQLAGWLKEHDVGMVA